VIFYQGEVSIAGAEGFVKVFGKFLTPENARLKNYRVLGPVLEPGLPRKYLNQHSKNCSRFDNSKFSD